jgi:glutamate-1-semialdehyde aminotransferase
LVGALGPNILGYCDPDVDRAIRHQLDKGISFSLATELEAELAELMCELIPCAEMVRFGKNGSDATSAAIRLARFYTGYDRVAIIAGEGYHGWHDWAVAGTERDLGVPGVVKSLTHRIPPVKNKIKEQFALHKYAAIMVDPENLDYDFLSFLREACTQAGYLLVFDEVRTGFRYALGGYQEYIDVTPDLACFGKSMANGMPISAVCGSKKIMKLLEEGVFWSGTFFGETLSLSAALATIGKIYTEGVVEHLWELGEGLIDEIHSMIGDMDGIAITGLGPRAKLDFHNQNRREKFMRDMIREGILVINSHNLCFSMGQYEKDRILAAYKAVLG